MVVGGNFGIRNSTCPGISRSLPREAKRVGRPVKWTCERHDAFASDFHHRDLNSKAELALDKDGRLLALRAVDTGNLGASVISFIPLAKGIAGSSSVYDIPCSSMRGRAVVTNTAPTTAGSHVRSGTANRHRLPPPRNRQPRSPAAQFRPANSDALPKPIRACIRQWQLPGLAAARGRAGRLGGGLRHAGRRFVRRSASVVFHANLYK